ncbi:MAG: PorT family protein [Fibrobacteria bacterium]|nr:PorT family protein [Fibrobacteria bacterium]
MKLRVCYLILFLFLSSYTAPDRFLNIGGGINMSKAGMGYNIGLEFEGKLTDNLSLMTGGIIDKKGDEGIQSDTIADSFGVLRTREVTLEAVYFQIPVFVKYDFNLGPITINAFGGPEIGIFLSNHLGVNKSDTLLIDGTDGPENALPYNWFDYGLSLGIGLELPVGDMGAFFIRPSYYLGLGSAFNTDTTTFINDSDNMKNGNLRIRLGYKINM